MTETKPKKTAPKKETKETIAVVKPKKESKSNKFAEGEYYAVIRLRGQVRIKKPVIDTLAMLNIKQRNHCSLQKMTPVSEGMIKKVKDYVTWGEINKETKKLLLEKKTETREDGEIKNCFRLSPPRGGFERKGTKKAFTQGGALGYRGQKINDLIKKMI